MMIEIVLLLRLVMIWSANHFWFGQSTYQWSLFVSFYQVFANLLPLLGFLIVLVQQVCQLHKQISDLKKRKTRQQELNIGSGSLKSGSIRSGSLSSRGSRTSSLALSNKANQIRERRISGSV